MSNVHKKHAPPPVNAILSGFAQEVAGSQHVRVLPDPESDMSLVDQNGRLTPEGVEKLLSKPHAFDDISHVD